MTIDQVPPIFIQMITIAIAAVVTYSVTNGAKALGGLFGIKMSDNWSKWIKAATATLVAAATSAVMGLITVGIGAIPEIAIPVVIQAFSLIAVLLGAMGIHNREKKAR